MTYTAEIGISSKIALGDKCAVTVVNDDDIRDGMEATDTPLAVDGDHTREQVIAAAEDVLKANGWEVVGDWEDGDDSYYVTVERSTVTVDAKELAALRLAAQFVLDHADDIDYNSQFAARHLRAEHPNATPEAESMTWAEADKTRKNLDATLAALQAAGIDA
ncbi:hypothetical protein PV377_02920 [Streptomyces ipomoeae]|uniref:hypothetical protein n=1 Tax=Streptomyces ipomoeae TaxID=103232 RepID=UPI0029B545CE|nr:hypothetical protein [Streptomyces ipomoeae]MDX2837964.1 hypothetical protein [Streptomyces ipomoeae]